MSRQSAGIISIGYDPEGTPWLWIGGTKEVGTLETEENPLDTGGSLP